MNSYQIFLQQIQNQFLIYPINVQNNKTLLFECFLEYEKYEKNNYSAFNIFNNYLVNEIKLKINNTYEIIDNICNIEDILVEKKYIKYNLEISYFYQEHVQINNPYKEDFVYYGFGSSSNYIENITKIFFNNKNNLYVDEFYFTENNICFLKNKLMNNFHNIKNFHLLSIVEKYDVIYFLGILKIV